MDKINIRLRELFDLHLSQSATELEREEFWDYVNDPVYGVQIQQMVSDVYEMEHSETGLDDLEKHVVLKNIFEQHKGVIRLGQDQGVIRLWPKVAVAAAIVLAVFGAGLFYFGNNGGKGVVKTVYQNDVKPGGNKAYLSLANGERIVLTDVKNGEIAKQAGITITKTADGQLEYKVAESKSASTGFNTIETPRGGQYTVVLPDGSKIFLNSASVLKYPVSFKGLLNRKVQLSGEGYFEISKDKKHPFIVESKGQEVEVLGTHFNVNAYVDEADVRTTLLEGSVKVWEVASSRSAPRNDTEMNSAQAKAKVLKPGQQAVLVGGNGLKVKEADLDDVMAWKNGKIIFHSESLPDIMRRVARWYDVEVIYQDDMSGVNFWGTIARTENISTLLDFFTETGNVKFKIAGRKIFVMKK